MICRVWHLCDDDGKRLLLYQKTSSSYSLTSCVWTGDSWSLCSNWHPSSKSSGSWRVWVPSIASIYLSQKCSGNTQIRTLCVFVGDEIDLLIQWGATMLPATSLLRAVHVHALCLHPSYLPIKIYSVIPLRAQNLLLRTPEMECRAWEGYTDDKGDDSQITPYWKPWTQHFPFF